MTLADELRGIKPCITVPVRMVIREDAKSDPFMPEAPRMEALEAWIKTAGQFTSQDISDVLAIAPNCASSMVSTLSKRNKIHRVGQIAGECGRKIGIWEALPDDKAEAAARKHFG